MAPTLSDDSAPCAALASPEAQSRPQQPQAAAQQLGRQRSLLEGDQRGVSKRVLAVLNQQVLSCLFSLELVLRCVAATQLSQLYTSFFWWWF